jgi:hypothetical protein
VSRQPVALRPTAIAGVLAATAVVLSVVLVLPPDARGATPVPCTNARVAGHWQRLPTPAAFTAYAVDPHSPWRIVGLTDSAVYLSDSAGCSWRSVLTVPTMPAPAPAPASSPAPPSPNIRFRAVTVLASHAILVVASDGARTRVVGSDSGEPGAWESREQGLPPAGVATAIGAAAKGSIAYVAFEPIDAPSSAGPLPDPSLSSGTAGPLIVVTASGGRSWSTRRMTGTTESIEELRVDEGTPSVLLARTTEGRVWRSTDGGASFSRLEVGDVRSMTTAAGRIALFTEGSVYVSADAGATFVRRPGPARVVGAAGRADVPEVIVELSGPTRLGLLSLGSGAMTDAGAGELTGPLRVTGGRVAGASTFQALSGSTLLRYTDTPDVASVPSGVRPPRPGTITPGHARIEVPDGSTRTVAYRLDLPRDPSPIDVFYLIDMTYENEDLRAGIQRIARSLSADGADVNVGLGLIGSRPRDLTRTDPPADPTYVDPSGSGRRYQRPQLYRLVRRIGPPDAAFAAAAAGALVPETHSRFTDDEFANLRPRGQWVSLDQLMTGSGLHDYRCTSATNCIAQPTYDVPPGQVAGWRQDPGVRRVVVMGTPGEFNHQPPPGSPPPASVVRRLVNDRVKVIGMAFRSSSWTDLEEVVRATGGLAGPRVVDCGSRHPEVAPGQPLVCGSNGDSPERILGMLRALPDRQAVALVPSGPPGLVAGIEAPDLGEIDVNVAAQLPAQVTFSCAGRSPGTYRATVAMQRRGAVIPSTPPTTTPAPSSPAAPSAGQLPPPAPATPVQVFQAQLQPQVDFQGALRSEQQMQLALAAAEAERPAPSVELAMSRRREDEEGDAVIALGLSMVVGSGFAAVAASSRRGWQGGMARPTIQPADRRRRRPR